MENMENKDEEPRNKGLIIDQITLKKNTKTYKNHCLIKTLKLDHNNKHPTNHN